MALILELALVRFWVVLFIFCVGTDGSLEGEHLVFDEGTLSIFGGWRTLHQVTPVHAGRRRLVVSDLVLPVSRSIWHVVHTVALSHPLLSLSLSLSSPLLSARSRSLFLSPSLSFSCLLCLSLFHSHARARAHTPTLMCAEVTSEYL
jgi:hypothetical protein